MRLKFRALTTLLESVVSSRGRWIYQLCVRIFPPLGGLGGEANQVARQAGDVTCLTCALQNSKFSHSQNIYHFQLQLVSIRPRVLQHSHHFLRSLLIFILSNTDIFTDHVCTANCARAPPRIETVILQNSFRVRAKRALLEIAIAQLKRVPWRC